MIAIVGKNGEGNSGMQDGFDTLFVVNWPSIANSGCGSIIVVNSSPTADSGPLGRIIVITALFWILNEVGGFKSLQGGKGM